MLSTAFLRSGVIAQGPEVATFEARIRRSFWTWSRLCRCQLRNVRPAYWPDEQWACSRGDEVIVP